jgi:hypothetical protein
LPPLLIHLGRPHVTYQAFIVRGFTGKNGTPHRTALTITGNNQRLKTSFPTTVFTVIAGRT